jgi:uncharacterized protein (UPF0303 family)
MAASWWRVFDKRLPLTVGHCAGEGFEESNDRLVVRKYEPVRNFHKSTSATKLESEVSKEIRLYLLLEFNLKGFCTTNDLDGQASNGE